MEQLHVHRLYMSDDDRHQNVIFLTEDKTKEQFFLCIVPDSLPDREGGLWYSWHTQQFLVQGISEA